MQEDLKTIKHYNIKNYFQIELPAHLDMCFALI